MEAQVPQGGSSPSFRWESARSKAQASRCSCKAAVPLSYIPWTSDSRDSFPIAQEGACPLASHRCVRRGKKCQFGYAGRIRIAIGASLMTWLLIILAVILFLLLTGF